MFFLPTFGSGVGGVINHKKAAPQTVRMTKKQEKCYMFFFQRCSVLKKPSLGCQMHRKCMEIKSFFCLKTGQTRRFNLWKFAVVVCLEKSSSEDWSVLPTFIKLQMALTGFFHYHFQHFWPFWAILSIRKSHFRRCGSKTSQGFGVGSKRRGGWKLYWPLTAAATHTAAAGRLAGWATGNFISPRETIRAAVCVWGGGVPRQLMVMVVGGPGGLEQIKKFFFKEIAWTIDSWRDHVKWTRITRDVTRSFLAWWAGQKTDNLHRNWKLVSLKNR